jgi:hypothetical protein
MQGRVCSVVDCDTARVMLEVAQEVGMGSNGSVLAEEREWVLELLNSQSVAQCSSVTMESN